MLKALVAKTFVDSCFTETLCEFRYTKIKTRRTSARRRAR